MVIESDVMSSEGNIEGSGAAVIYQAESPDEKALVEFARKPATSSSVAPRPELPSRSMGLRSPGRCWRSTSSTKTGNG